MSAGEIPRHPPDEPDGAVVASMRPRRVCRGNGGRAGRPPRRGGASMRPRRVCRGNGGFSVAALLPVLASMRPRRVCRGKGVRRAQVWRWNQGFNEAPACLPGKSGRPAPPRRRRGRASMRPRRVCRGNEVVRGELLMPGGRASMRPRRVCRGNRCFALSSLWYEIALQ